MPTGYEVQTHHNIARIANAAARIADALERLAAQGDERLDRDRERRGTIDRLLATADSHRPSWEEYAAFYGIDPADRPPQIGGTPRTPT